MLAEHAPSDTLGQLADDGLKLKLLENHYPIFRREGLELFQDSEPVF